MVLITRPIAHPDAAHLLRSKFVPGTGDQVIVALKSMEETVENEGGASEQLQDTYLMVFNLDGEVLLEETEVRGPLLSENVRMRERLARGDAKRVLAGGGGGGAGTA